MCFRVIIFTEQVNKIALCTDDDKWEICDNKIDTFAHGHYTTTTTVHDVWAKNRNTQGQTEGPRGRQGTLGKTRNPGEQGPKAWKSACDVINCRAFQWYAWLIKWAILSGEYNKQTRKERDLSIPGSLLLLWCILGWLTIGLLGRCCEGIVICLFIIAWRSFFMWNRHCALYLSCASLTKAMVGYSVFAPMILNFGILHLWLHYRPIDSELPRNFLLDPSWRQVGHP